MTDTEREKFIRKYMPVALEHLMSNVLPQAEKDTEYINKIVEEDKDIIVEVDENSGDGSEGESNVPLFKENKNESFQIVNKSNLVDTEEKSSILQESVTSFELLENSQSKSFSLINEESEEIYEILEDLDPEDEWIQSDAGSVVDSIASTINKDGTIISDYSIIDNTYAAALNQAGKLISTKTDIFIEDQAIRKIIEYIGMFSSEVSTILKSFKSAESLVSAQEIAENWELASLIDLDEISSELLGLILDTLEEFGMYKMCLFVCNRYHLEGRLGRYVASLAFKYSIKADLKPHEINRPTFIKIQTHRAALGYNALHNVFEMLNPEYLALKRYFDVKSLGIESFRGLLLLGF